MTPWQASSATKSMKINENVRFLSIIQRVELLNFRSVSNDPKSSS